MIPRVALLLGAALLAGGCRPGSPAPPGPADGADAGARARRADAVLRARTLEAAGDAGGAEAEWEAVLREDPAHGSALYATARLLRARGEGGAALARLETLRTVEPGAGRGLLLAAEILSDPGAGPLRDPGRAEGLAREALALNPEESRPYLVLGEVLLLGGRDGEAAGRLAVAARMNPRDSESRSLLGVLHLRSGRREEARRAFGDALRAAAPFPLPGAAGGGIPGEGDTAASLAPGRAPTGGELRAVAGLGALGVPVPGTREGPPPPERPLAALREALERRGTGEAVLGGAAAVAVPGGGIAYALSGGGGTAVGVLR